MRPMLRWSHLALLLTACTARFAAPPPAPKGVVRADLHLHVTMAQAARPLVHGESGDGLLATFGGARLLNQVDDQMLQASGVRLAFAALWPPFEARVGRTALDEALEQLDGLKRFTRRRSGYQLALTAAQARAGLAKGRVVLLPQVEGGEGIQKVEDVDALYARGMRCVTLVHFTSNALGGAAKGQLAVGLFGIKLEGLEPQGLTPLGREVVERLFDLGVVVDLAHASDALTRDVLALSEARGVPVIVSHGGTRAFQPIERNVSDELAARVVKGGGLVGVTVYSGQVAGVPAEARAAADVPGSCDDVIAHWSHFAQATGHPERVMLGSDLNGFVVRAGPGGSCPNGLRHAGDLSDLYAGLRAHGQGEKALDASGEVLLSVLDQVEAHASAEARAHALQAEPPPSPDLFDVGF